MLITNWIQQEIVMESVLTAVLNELGTTNKPIVLVAAHFLRDLMELALNEEEVALSPYRRLAGGTSVGSTGDAVIWTGHGDSHSLGINAHCILCDLCPHVLMSTPIVQSV